MLSLTGGDAERPGLLGYIKGLRFIRIEAFDTDAAVTATELLRFGHSWAAVHAIHAACPSAAHPNGRFLLTVTPKAYASTGVQAVFYELLNDGGGTLDDLACGDLVYELTGEDTDRHRARSLACPARR